MNVERGKAPWVITISGGKIFPAEQIPHNITLDIRYKLPLLPLHSLNTFSKVAYDDAVESTHFKTDELTKKTMIDTFLTWQDQGALQVNDLFACSIRSIKKWL